MTRVDVEYMRHLRKETERINSIPLGEIEFYLNDRLVEIPREDVEHWKWTSLNNFHFIEDVLDDEDNYVPDFNYFWKKIEESQP